MPSAIKSPPLFAVAAILFFFTSCSRHPGEIKVLFNSSEPAARYDPARAAINQHYVFLENVYSALIEYSESGELTSGLAKTFRWHGNEARFDMRRGQFTVDGTEISAYDAEFSLKRLFTIEKSPLANQLCGKPLLKSVSDFCPGLEVLDNGRTLSMRFDRKNDFLFHTLTDIRYVVIPRTSVSAETLSIVDYRNTSGPYFVSSDPADGAWRLAANPRHYRYSPGMPQSIQALPLTGMWNNGPILERMATGEFDYLLSNLVKSPSEKLSFANTHRNYNVHVTQPVRLIYIVFTAKGQRRLALKERFYIAQKLRETYLSGREMCAAPYQFFRLDGSLDRAQLKEIKSLLEAESDMRVTKSMTVAKLKQYLFRPEDDLSRWLPNLSTAAPADAIGTEEGPDFYLNAGDAGFQDDIGLVANYLGLPFFDIPEREKEEWLRNYVSAAARKSRSELLRQLQYRTLKRGVALPVAIMPYASLVRKPWKLNYPASFGSDNFWRLRR